jgi:uncharacterized surface protein with fasciclin (FAS1) repeats
MSCAAPRPVDLGGARDVSAFRQVFTARSDITVATGVLPSRNRNSGALAMKLKSTLSAAVAASMIAAAPLAAWAYGSYSAKASTAPAAKADIVDTAVAAGQFNTLAKALTAAGLVDTLKGPGPFTVFAPTDEAFAKIPADKLNALLADKAALTKVLTYHVVGGKVMSADVKTGAVKTVQGSPLNVVASPTGVSVNDAKVIKADIAATNGVIHVIDTVVLPN